MSDRPFPHQLRFSFVTESNIKEKINHTTVPSRKATFKDGLTKPIHRWFRLTPSFGPSLVNKMLNDMNYWDGEVVLDPFAGAGTTLIESQINGIESYGFEINPFLHFVCKVSLNWQLEPHYLLGILESIEDKFSEYQHIYSEEDLENGNLKKPNIHNPYRWWRKDVLKDALCLKLAIKHTDAPQEVRDFFYLALAAILVPDLTNVTLGRLQLHFIDRSNDHINTWELFSRHARMMIQDLSVIHRKGFEITSTPFLTDATNLRDINLVSPVNYVITSPPYPNRYSYVWNTRPHLYFFDFFNQPKQASELDKITIGGTWGSATSVLAKGVIPPAYPIVEEVVVPVADEIRQKENGNLMANYLIKYFNLLARQLFATDKFLSPTAKLAYVVGCSRLKGVFIETDVLLGQIMEGLGLNYRVYSIERIRKRNSGKDLYESIVYAHKLS